MSAMDDDDLGLGVRKVPKVAKVKNKTPAPVQITAEQLLREAKERELELVQPPPKQKISDEAELRDYQMRKRKAFEDAIRKNRSVMVNWLKYASWEESQHALRNARSVYERALDVDHRNVTVWLKYAEMEMRNRQVNSARNVWDRAVTILPRVNQFWYKYTYMEELLKNIAGGRQVFERWMEWEPEEQAWHSYINFELRYKELDRARVIYERFVIVHPTVKNWIKYARFEEKHSYISSARSVYERAVEYFGDDYIDEELFVAFSKFEESQREHDRARVIYKYALDHLPKDKCQLIYKQFTVHEKKFGDRSTIEDVIVSKRKFTYEEEVQANPFNYDTWFDYLRMMESDGSESSKVRDLYERAISNVPPSREKRHWRRYIYLWINYALYEELECGDVERVREVYKVCLELIPHKSFTFAKVWLMAAQFEIRQKNLTKARKILGYAIGTCPKEKLFRGYIELEIQLREFQRCRVLYEKFLDFAPENCTTWMKYAELETILGDIRRARAIFELAIGQVRLDMPEVLWKAYIDFEVDQEEYKNTTKLYRRLLERTQHVKVWMSFARFELLVDDGECVSRAREVYREAHRALRSCEEKEERLMLLEAWRDFEKENGTEKTQEDVHKLMPNKIKRRRKIQTESGADAGWEEYYDYIFPDDQSAQPNLKLLAMAKSWKIGALDTSSVIRGSNDSDSDGEETAKSKTSGQEEHDTKGSTSSSSDDEVSQRVKNRKGALDTSSVTRGSSDSDSDGEETVKSKTTGQAKRDRKRKSRNTASSSDDEASERVKNRKGRDSSTSSSVYPLSAPH